eukprot:6221744-Prymnesium_polylepis.1
MGCTVPAELAVNTTGHELKKGCAMYEYMDAELACCIPGATVLSGHKPLPPWQMGPAPLPPSLCCIVGVDPLMLERFADELFSFHDATPIMLLHGGGPPTG